MRIYSFFDKIENHREYSERKIKLDSSPTIENIEIISKCNLKCKMCIKTPKRNQDLLTLNQISEIIDKNIELLRGEYVWLHHYGESLLHPQLTDVISYLNKKDVNSRLSTNATLLNPKKSRELIKVGLKEIVFSIDGINKSWYESIRIGADFDEVLKNINEFLEIKEEMGYRTPITQVQFININGSKEETNQYIDYWSKKNVNFINIKIPSTRAGKVSDKGILSKILSNKQYNKTERIPCFRFWDSLVILSDGNVTPCCHDLEGELIIGNAFEDKLINIWNSETVKMMRKEQIKGEYELSKICKDCPETIGYSCSFEEKLNQENNKLKKYREEGKIKFNSHTIIENEKKEN